MRRTVEGNDSVGEHKGGWNTGVGKAASLLDDAALAHGFARFVNECPTPFHAVSWMSERLDAVGFEHLREVDSWQLEAGHAYYVVRNESSLIAFRMGTTESLPRFNIAAAHVDSPALRIKPVAELAGPGEYVRLNVEVYGSINERTWLDRPLSVAGRVLVRANGRIESRLFAPRRDVVIIPSVAIHLNRKINEEGALNRQIDLCPLFGAAPDTDAKSANVAAQAVVTASAAVGAPENEAPVGVATPDDRCMRAASLGMTKTDNVRAAQGLTGVPAQATAPRVRSNGGTNTSPFDAFVAHELGVAPEQIVASDLIVCNRQSAFVWGESGEFVSGPRLDDLLCAYAGFEAMLAVNNVACDVACEERTTPVLICVNNEEVGSTTMQGANSSFVRDVLERIVGACDVRQDAMRRAMAQSFVASCDNAQAVHPNHPELLDQGNRCWLNGGPVIKESAQQRYATDAVSRAVFEEVCSRAGVPTQVFATRSDIPCGSTIGNMLASSLGVRTVDVGAAQLAMHSSYETAGAHDVAHMARALASLFVSDILLGDDGSVAVA